MAFVITELCIGTTDQSCVSVCPVDCIHFEEGADQLLYINPAECIDCGACQPACPVNAIFPEADVPEASRKFIEINALWFEDPAAARAMVGGAAPPAPAAAPAAAPSAEAATPGEAPADAAPSEAPAETAGEASAAPAAAAAAPAAPPPPVAQVPAGVGMHAPEVSTYRLPSPASFVVLLLIGLSVWAMFVFPGPALLTLAWAEDLFKLVRIDNGGKVGLTVAALLPVLPLLIILFITLQARTFAHFAASHDRPLATWRQRYNEWRRNEESRQHRLVEAVEAIARDRFNFPDDRNPDLQTFVNLPAPTMGVEVRGSGDKMFPDIVTVAQPGAYPVAIVQVESHETVSRDQARFVWAQLENRDCPLYVYVPAGRLGQARDYALAEGIKNVKFRTWRWSPNGMVVKEA